MFLLTQVSLIAPAQIHHTHRARQAGMQQALMHSTLRQKKDMDEKQEEVEQLMTARCAVGKPHLPFYAEFARFSPPSLINDCLDLVQLVIVRLVQVFLHQEVSLLVRHAAQLKGRPVSMQVWYCSVWI